MLSQNNQSPWALADRSGHSKFEFFKASTSYTLWQSSVYGRWSLAAKGHCWTDLRSENFCVTDCFLGVLIQEYLESRKAAFPQENLIPKHDYLRHYPGLILKFSPLIRLWTIRFESKHRYFKICTRHLKNFKNLCHTLSERHQLCQAYLTVGPCPPALQIKGSSPFCPELYSEAVKNAVSQFSFSETQTKVARLCL